MDEIIKLSGAVIHLEHGAVQQNTTPALFFLNGNNASTLTGDIVSVEVNGAGNICCCSGKEQDSEDKFKITAKLILSPGIKLRLFIKILCL